MRSLQRGEMIAVALGVVIAGWFFTFGSPFENEASGAKKTASVSDSLQQNEVLGTQAVGEMTAGTVQSKKSVTGKGQTANVLDALENNQTNVTTDTQNVTELIVKDEVVGTGAVATSGKTVSVHYTGTFTNGQKFDSSVDRGQPFEFILGAGQVIAGWDQGVLGMKVGGKRKLVIPSSLGYGDNDYGPIPGKSTLLFDVELLGVK